MKIAIQATIEADFYEEVKTAFGDQAVKPAEVSQENLDKTVDKVPTLSEMGGDFKGDVDVVYTPNPKSSKLGLTIGTGEKRNKVDNVKSPSWAPSEQLGSKRDWRRIGGKEPSPNNPPHQAKRKAPIYSDNGPIPKFSTPTAFAPLNR